MSASVLDRNPRVAALLSMLAGVRPTPDVFCNDVDCTECDPETQTFPPSPVPWISPAGWARLRRDLVELSIHPEPERWANRGDKGDQRARRTLRDLAAVCWVEDDLAATALSLLHAVANPSAPLSVYEAVVRDIECDVPVATMRAAVRRLNDGATQTAIGAELGVDRKTVGALDARFGVSEARTLRLESTLRAWLAEGKSLRAFCREHGVATGTASRLAARLAG